MLLGGGVFGLAVLIFWIWAIFDVIKTDEVLVRHLPKGVWLMLVIILFDIGAIAWLLLGRPEGVGFSPGDTNPREARRAQRPAPLEAADRHMTAADRRATREQQRREFEEVDRRLNEERAARRREIEEQRAGDQRAKDLADWEADLLRREKELREQKRTDEPL